MGCPKQCEECGCEYTVKDQCIKIQRDYPAIGIVAGDSLESALEKLNAKAEEWNDIQDGVSVISANVDINNLLTLTLSNNEVIEAGTITIP